MSGTAARPWLPTAAGREVNARKGLRGSGPGIRRLTAFRESVGVDKEDAVSMGKDPTALRQTLGFLAERYPIRTVSVFGPAARGGLRPDRDIDLPVEFKPQGAPSLWSDCQLRDNRSRVFERASAL